MVALDPSPPVARRGDLVSSSAGLAYTNAQPDCVVERSLLSRRRLFGRAAGLRHCRRESPFAGVVYWKLKFFYLLN